MSAFLASGHAVDVVLVFMLLEAAWLIALRRASAVSVMLLLLPGALMMIALRGALTGAHWVWIAAPLAASLPVHLADLRRRRLA